MLEYIRRTEDVRKTSYLFISYITFNRVTTSTLARWLKTVLMLAGIDDTFFKAHSYRGASTSAALASGCTLNDILNTANWASAKTFNKFYNKHILEENAKFMFAMFHSVV